jgi:hypothetical protein
MIVGIYINTPTSAINCTLNQPFGEQLACRPSNDPTPFLITTPSFD